MVNIVEDCEVVEEYAEGKQDLYQILYKAKGVEIGVAVSRIESTKEFRSAENPLLNRIPNFSNSQRYIKVSENIRDEFFFK